MAIMLEKILQANRDEQTSVYRDASSSEREAILPGDLKVPASLPRLLLVDDDPTFGKLMQRAASQSGVPLTFCKNLEEFGNLKTWDFDVVIMDFDLGAVTGVELASYLEKYTKEEIPVILVSQTKQTTTKEWPDTMREFVHKSLGPFAILDAAFEAHEIRRIHKSISDRQLKH